jgi:transcriptional regulator with XRE-family HTH domain
MANTREILAKNLKENRQKLGFTQAELAEKAEISTNFVAMIELKHKFPAPETLDRLAAALGLQVPELFFFFFSPEEAIEKFHYAILDNLDQAVEKALDKAIDKRCKNNKFTL